MRWFCELEAAGQQHKKNAKPLLIVFSFHARDRPGAQYHGHVTDEKTAVTTKLIADLMSDILKYLR